MTNRPIVRALSLLISLVLALGAFVSCTGGNEAQSDTTVITFESLPPDAPYAVQDFDLTDVLDVFARKDGAEYAVSSPEYGVDHAEFEALFNLILYFEVTRGDGEYDEFDTYFDEGSLSPDERMKGQTMPDSELSWYADTRSKALKVCFDTLHYFTYAKEHTISPISRLNEAKIRKIMKPFEQDAGEADLASYFGEGATTAVLRAAAALYVIADDPSAFVAYDDVGRAPRPEYEVDSALLPNVASHYGI